MNQTRTVFYVSDGTGITAESVGHSLISQFEGINFRQERVPFIDSLEKAQECIERIDEVHQQDGKKPIVISTLVRPEIAALIRSANGMVIDCFATFIAPLEEELGCSSTHTIGRSHGGTTSQDYLGRIDAINFTLAHDDGITDNDLESADIIMVGVSRSGKTPTSLYLAMQFGVKAANYPLIPEDFERNCLPPSLEKYRHKLFGLTISPERLTQIRQQRRPNSKYASIENCRWEIEQAQKLMLRTKIPCIDSTTKSIEEIAAKLLQTVIGKRNH